MLHQLGLYFELHIGRALRQGHTLIEQASNQEFAKAQTKIRSLRHTHMDWVLTNRPIGQLACNALGHIIGKHVPVMNRTRLLLA